MLEPVVILGISILFLAVALVWQVCLASYCIRSRKRSKQESECLRGKNLNLNTKNDSLKKEIDYLSGYLKETEEVRDEVFEAIIPLIVKGINKKVCELTKKDKLKEKDKLECSYWLTAVKYLSIEVHNRNPEFNFKKLYKAMKKYAVLFDLKIEDL